MDLLNKVKEESIAIMRKSLPTIALSAIIERWHWGKNVEFNPNSLTLGSSKKVWWKGPCGHEWERAVKKEVSSQGCPQCEPSLTARKAAKTKSLNSGFLTNVSKDLAKEYSLKNSIPISEVSVKSGKLHLWCCSSCGWEWSASPWSRSRGWSKCPSCSMKVLHVGVNDLKTFSPKLASEWSERSEFSADEVLPNSKSVVWWRCSLNPKHEWEGSIAGRALKRRECPHCWRGSRVSSGQRELFLFLKEKEENTLENCKVGRVEVDCYLPTLKMAFEFNGEYWHSKEVVLKKTGGTVWEQSHQKWLACAEQGVILFFVWEGDWLKEKAEVKEAIEQAMVERKACENVNYKDFPPILLKWSGSKEEESVKEWTQKEMIVTSVSQSPKIAPRKTFLSLQEVEEFQTAYLSGESVKRYSLSHRIPYGLLATVVEEGGLLEERRKVGLDKHGRRCLSPLEEVEAKRMMAEGFSEDSVRKRFGLGYKQWIKWRRGLDG